MPKNYLRFTSLLSCFLLIILSILVRLYFISQRELHPDEYILNEHLEYLPSIWEYSKIAYIPPLNLYLYKALSIFGKDNLVLSLRLPSFILGLASIYMSFHIGKTLKDWHFGILLATLYALQPDFLHWSTLGRHYSTSLFVLLLFIYFYLRFLKSFRILDLIGTSFSSLLVYYSNYFSTLLIFIFWLLLFIKIKRKENFPIKTLLIYFLIPCLLSTTWLTNPIFLYFNKLYVPSDWTAKLETKYSFINWINCHLFSPVVLCVLLKTKKENHFQNSRNIVLGTILIFVTGMSLIGHFLNINPLERHLVVFTPLLLICFCIFRDILNNQFKFLSTYLYIYIIYLFLSVPFSKIQHWHSKLTFSEQIRITRESGNNAPILYYCWKPLIYMPRKSFFDKHSVLVLKNDFADKIKLSPGAIVIFEGIHSQNRFLKKHNITKFKRLNLRSRSAIKIEEL